MKYPNIIGREVEISTLERLYKSKKSEFVAIYGRRRIGKSYLVSEVYGSKIVFTAVGTYVKDGDKNYETYRKLQLDHFYDSLIMSGLDATATERPTCWREAYLLLRRLLEGIHSRRKVILIDELPWLAGPQSSEMISELGYFWNSWADSQRNIILVVCGSATSWMLDNVIRDYGGLHGRLTETIKLSPFTLAECQKYYRRNGFRLSRYEMCISYMALGGVPFYLDKLRNSQTITENIDRIFFADEKIHQEFMDVYAGLYASKERYVDIVKVLGSQFYGMTQKEISTAIDVKSGGTLTKLLENLMESGIIRAFVSNSTHTPARGTPPSPPRLAKSRASAPAAPSSPPDPSERHPRRRPRALSHTPSAASPPARPWSLATEGTQERPEQNFSVHHFNRIKLSSGTVPILNITFSIQIE